MRIRGPLPRTLVLAVLTGVTCASPSDCWAVGQYYDDSSSSYQALIERWDGTSWAIVTSPNTTGNVLRSVTCASASDCWAVGGYVSGGVSKTLIERWDGTSWAIFPSPNTKPWQGNSLSAVTCTSALDCWAVGSYNSDIGSIDQTLIVRYTGTEPTAVAATAISAHRSGSGVVVRWRGTDPSVLGYHVYREQAGARIRLTQRLVAARLGGSGRTYRFVDRSARRGPLRYWIQAVWPDGSTDWVGSVRVRGKALAVRV